ncbi:hypothetical protein EVJ50_11890 [Synechococcus sp. RSCCF101]|uniref:glycosyltransferase family 39 protein n=1 Tax=Synechococcus sp. RSCCF101 TaxID=2511069 RepID=UPI00124616E1|nr:glycosyltransferase family 39 protein [Synechococcus sp. RSCCF101]QEY32830.1 hypothetical protein EVJ50_11890 [Synechococcus sp. RSCCF101]
MPLVLTAVAIAVLASEPWIVDHYRKGHFNWVSVHSLAIARHSLPAFGGVGYSCEWIRPSGSHFDYFNRYPIGFALLSRWLLSPWETDPAAYLYAARQWMNALFLFTLAALYSLLRQLGGSRTMAVVAVLGSACAPAALHYKSMFHFDQPALLAYVLVILAAIAVFTTPRRPAWPYLGALGVGVLVGRSAILLCFSLALAVVLSWRSRREPHAGGGTGARAAWSGVGLAVSLLAIATSYNVIQEARANGTSWIRTSIVESSQRRLGFTGRGFSEEHLQRSAWTGGAIPEMLENLRDWISPVLPVVLLLLLLLVLLQLLSGRAPWRSLLEGRAPRLACGARSRRALAVPVVGLASLLWLVLMKNLVVFHDYALMMLLPLLSVILMGLGERLELLAVQLVPRLGRAVAPTMVLAVLGVMLVQAVAVSQSRLHPSAERQERLDLFFSQLQAFRLVSDPRTPVRHEQDWLPGSPYAQCLLLDQPLWTESSTETADGLAAQEPELLSPPRLPPCAADALSDLP